MRNFLLVVGFIIMLCGSLSAAERNVLVNGSGEELGTSGNPIYINLSGGGGGSGVFEVVDGELALDATNSGYNVNLQNDLSITNDLSVANNVLYVDSSQTYVGINTSTPTNHLDVVGGATIDGSTLYVDDTTNRVGILTTSPSVDGLEINGDLSASQSATIGNSLFIGGGAANKLVNGVETIGVSVKTPGEDLFYFTGVDAEWAPNGFTLTDVIISRDLTVDTNNVTVTVSKRTNASQALTTIEEITLDSNEWRDEDDGTLTVSAITADDELGFAVNTTQTGAIYALRLYGYKNNS